MMPSVFLSHGAPPLLDDRTWMRELAGWAEDLPRPQAILIVSAHWENAPIALSSGAAATPLVYDFGGFDPRFYRLRYPTPAAAALVDRVAGLLPDGQQVVRTDRGLDHGAWVPLMAMYPEADIPVLQMSLPTADPHALLELGARLRPLRDEGVLVIGSGFTTHGLPYLRPQNWAGDPTPPGWSRDFDDWARERLQAGDVEALADFRRAAPGMPYAHPTVEHFTPLFVALGAATDAETPGSAVIDGFFMGLSKRSLQFA